MAKNLCWCYRIKGKKGEKRKSQYLKSRPDQTNLPGFTPISEGFAEQDADALVQPHMPLLGQDTASASQQHLLKVCGSSASKVTTWCGPLSSTKRAPTLLMDVISGRHFWVNERRNKKLKIQLSEFGAEELHSLVISIPRDKRWSWLICRNFDLSPYEPCIAVSYFCFILVGAMLSPIHWKRRKVHSGTLAETEI